MQSKHRVSLCRRKVSISSISIPKINNKSLTSLACQLIDPAVFADQIGEEYLNYLAMVEPILVSQNLELVAGFNTFFTYKKILNPRVKISVLVISENKEVFTLLSLYLTSDLIQKKKLFQTIKANKKEHFQIFSKVFPAATNLKNIQSIFGLTNAQVRSPILATSEFERAFQQAGRGNYE